MDLDLLQSIKAQYADMSKGQKQIALYILENYDKAAFITASKMGQVVGVSESTVVRFAYAMGYDGYPELQRSLQELIRNKLTSVQRMQLSSEMKDTDVLKTVLKSDMQNIRSTIEQIDESAFHAVVDSMLHARTVYILGLRSSSPLAEFFAYYLGFVLDDVRVVTSGMGDVFEQMVRITEKDLCVAISFPRYSSRTIEALKYSKSKGAVTATMTDSLLSPLASIADYCLIARSDMASFADSLVAPLSLINALIVALGRQKNAEVTERLILLEKIWNDKGVYTVSDKKAESGIE